MRRFLVLIATMAATYVAFQTLSSSPLHGPVETTAVAQTPGVLPSRIRERNSSGLPQPEYTEEELANIRVYEMANESVVNITTSTVQYDRFFGVPIPGKGSGSGSILDEKGHVLTNYHVVEDADRIDVTLANGTTYDDARLVGSDKDTDIAVLRIDAPKEELSPITLGTSDGLRVGQRVYVLGNPFGLERSLSTGIISSLNRTPFGDSRERALKSLIQTDAAMNPGNSGGPMLNTRAEMIGMNIAIATKTGQNAGVGFAIPANRIRRIVSELIRNGRVVRADHGILSVRETSRGIRIHQLVESGPADRAGLRGFRFLVEESVRGGYRIQKRVADYNHADYILSIEGNPTRTHSEFLDVIEQYRPGQTVTFTILRDGEQRDLPVTLGAT